MAAGVEGEIEDCCCRTEKFPPSLHFYSSLTLYFLRGKKGGGLYNQKGRGNRESIKRENFFMGRVVIHLKKGGRLHTTHTHTHVDVLGT